MAKVHLIYFPGISNLPPLKPPHTCMEEDHPLPQEDQLPSTAHNGLVTRLRSVLIFYGNQVRHLTGSTPHRAQVSSANPGDEALAASPSTTHKLATTCQMKGHRPSTRPKIQRPPEGHVDDRKA
uniref:Uncharacterized protein n=1 Tax=Fagus sylvatica TaxID=28930 RepID=A0A2N9G333_FAGSY